MTVALADEVAAKVRAGLAAVSELMGCSLSGCSDDELLDVVREVERLRRMVEAFDNVSIPELEARNLAGRLVVRGTRQLLGGLLNLSPAEAGARVRAAHALGARVQLTGEVLPPSLPLLAQARADGAVTARQAEVIIRCVDTLRVAPHLTTEDVSEAEAFLVEQAGTFDARVLAGIGQRLADTLDPDGALGGDERQQRRRFLSLLPRGDGMWRLTADLDAETAAMAMTVLHSLAAPKPGTANPAQASDGATGNVGHAGERPTGSDADSDASSGDGSQGGDRDERTSGQRLHDALTAVLKLALRSGTLPRSGGIPATVLLTMTAEQFETRTGLAVTSFGQQLTVSRALRLADQASIAWIVHNSTGGVLNYGTTRRFANENQTLALISRDQGCAFPGCTDPPEWTERHHIQPWSQGGPTNLDNLCLLCDFHHDRIDTGGWTIQVREGVPWFTPPAWIDPHQTPRRNERR